MIYNPICICSCSSEKTRFSLKMVHENIHKQRQKEKKTRLTCSKQDNGQGSTPLLILFGFRITRQRLSRRMPPFLHCALKIQALISNFISVICTFLLLHKGSLCHRGCGICAISPEGGTVAHSTQSGRFGSKEDQVDVKRKENH